MSILYSVFFRPNTDQTNLSVKIPNDA